MKMKNFLPKQTKLIFFFSFSFYSGVYFFHVLCDLHHNQSTVIFIHSIPCLCPSVSVLVSVFVCVFIYSFSKNFHPQIIHHYHCQFYFKSNISTPKNFSFFFCQHWKVNFALFWHSQTHTQTNKKKIPTNVLEKGSNIKISLSSLSVIWFFFDALFQQFHCYAVCVRVCVLNRSPRISFHFFGPPTSSSPSSSSMVNDFDNGWKFLQFFFCSPSTYILYINHQ